MAAEDTTEYEVKVVDSDGVVMHQTGGAPTHRKAMDYAYNWYEAQLRALDEAGNSSLLMTSIAEARKRLKGCRYFTRTVVTTYTEWEEV